MPQKIQRKSDEEMLVTHPIRGNATGWFFRLEETSAGAWLIHGADAWGRTILIGGHDEDDLMDRAEEKAQTINDNLDDT